MLKKFWNILFGKPVPADEELPRLTRWLLEIRYITYVFIVTFFIVQPLAVAGYDTPTGSMEPTIMTNSRYLALSSVYGGFFRFTDIKLPGYQTIHRGDIVIFKFPLDESKSYVKRVIGLPGETVEVRDKTVLVDGKVIPEPYAHYHDNSPYNRYYGPETIPHGQLFVMGDNRDDSYDSRAWGFVPLRSVYGTPLFTYWSYDSEKHRIRFTDMFRIVK